MAVNPNDLIYTTIETVNAFSLTDDYLWTLDELSQVTISNTEESEDVTGKNGRLLSSLKRNKGVTISGTNGVISGGMMATQVGSEFKSGSDLKVRVTEYLTLKASGDGANLTIATGSPDTVTFSSGTAVGVQQTAQDGTVTAFTKLGSDTAFTASAKQFKVGTGVLTFPEGTFTGGETIAIIYDKTVTGSSVSNIADDTHFAGKVKLYVDAFAEDKCGKIYKVQFYFPKVDFNGSFDIDMGGNQVTHGFEAKSLSGGCATLSNRGILWTYTVFGETTAA